MSRLVRADVAFEPLGDGAARFALPEGTDPRVALEALRECAGVVDAIVCETHACVYFDEPPAWLTTDGAARARLMASIARASATLATSPRVHAVRVRYDGEDLGVVAARASLSALDVARVHASREYVVRMIGFQPGFAYLGDVDAAIATPRRASPRTRVPAGAVAIGGRYTGVYPFPSPGGWNLIGTTLDFAAFEPARGATFALGDRVRFEIAT